jgi:hypothetical protein
MKEGGIEYGKVKDPTTYNSWIDRGPPKNILSYFPNMKIKTGEILKLFIRHTKKEDAIVKLQKMFSEMTDDCVVDCTTTDKSKFCQSLVNQLMQSFGLPSLEELKYDTESERREAMRIWETEAKMSIPNKPEEQYEYWTGKYSNGKKIYGKILNAGKLPTTAEVYIIIKTNIVGFDMFESIKLTELGNCSNLQYAPRNKVDISRVSATFDKYGNITLMPTPETRGLEIKITIEYTCARS